MSAKPASASRLRSLPWPKFGRTAATSGTATRCRSLPTTRRLAAKRMQHVVAAVIAADHLVAAVGRGQQVARLDAHAVQAGLDGQLAEIPNSSSRRDSRSS